jgi:ATP:cob(I)alamin adenosyltransferase
MKIYTKMGDNLKTNTFGRRVFKDDLVIEAGGTIDELQSIIMVAYNQLDSEDLKSILLKICKSLFTIGYDISCSGDSFAPENVLDLERTIDHYEIMLKPLTEFVIPGLTKASSFLHLARAVSRRCERIIVKYALDNFVNYNIIKYINRLSDLLFTIARYVEEE